MDTHYHFLFSTCKSWVILCNLYMLASVLLFRSFAQIRKVVITDNVCYRFLYRWNQWSVLKSGNYSISAAYMALCAITAALNQFI